MKKENVEEWKAVMGYEGYYEINIHGVVRSLHKRNFHYTMEQRIDRAGYYTVRLAKPGKKSCTVYVHRLLGMAFIVNPENKCCINHRDGNKRNNSIVNLEWVTYSENNRHAYKIGLSKPFGCREIIDVFTGQIFKSLKEAAEYFNIEYSTFKNYMNGNRTNPTSMRYLYEKLIPIAEKEALIGKGLLSSAFRSTLDINPLFYQKPGKIIPIIFQNSFLTSFSLSNWRCNSLTA